MRNERVNYDLIDELYMDWLNEEDIIIKRKKKEDIRRQISPHDLLAYSLRFALPFNVFKDIFSLFELFKTVQEMDESGEDISDITNRILSVQSIEDIQALDQFVMQSSYNGLKELKVNIQGSHLFEYGDVKSIGERFPYACVNFINLESIKQLITKEKEYKGVPVIITIDNIGELPLDELNIIENKFDVIGIRIIEKGRTIRGIRTQDRPISIEEYKQIREKIDNDYLNKLYINNKEDNNTFIDLQLATQIINLVVDKIEYDQDFKERTKVITPEEWIKYYSDVSNIKGIITGKVICGGYSTIIRNLLSCVGIECRTILGLTYSGGKHAWNQMKIGDTWVDTDVTQASEKIRKGECSGQIFMSDDAFFGEYRKVVFNKGQVSNGESIETEAIIGGHAKAIDNNSEKCNTYFPPYIITILLRDAKKYQDAYEANGRILNNDEIIPYIGSDIEKSRNSRSKNEQEIYYKN